MAIKHKFNTEPVYLMDGSAFVYRSFYANRHLARSDGYPTNALAIVTRLLLKLLREEQPKYFLFALDGCGKNFRHEIYDKYKANRHAMPEELALQIDPIKKMVQALGISLHIAKNYEADDCIASLAAKFASEKPIIIISGDKDLKQCLSSNVFMWDPASKEEKFFTMENFEAETGIPPYRWPDMQALTGDASDNIPGVPGIGPKTAIQIFSKCSSLENIRDNIANLPAKIRAKIEPHLAEMFIWRKLARLKDDVCSSMSLADLKLKKPDLDACDLLAREFELFAIGKEIERLAQRTDMDVSNSSGHEKKEQRRTASAAGTIAELPDCKGKAVSVIFQDSLQFQPSICIISKIGDTDLSNDFLWTGSMAELCRYLENADKIVVHRLKTLMRSFCAFKELAGRLGTSHFIDLGLAAYLLNPEDDDYSWQRISASCRDNFGDARQDAGGLGLLMADFFLRNLKNKNLLFLYEKIEMPLIQVLYKMEERGFAIDANEFQVFLGEVQTEIQKLSQEIFDLAGEKFNIRSSLQLGEILFKKLGLASAIKTRGGKLSTSEAALEKLDSNEIIFKILQFRKLDKMQSTYLEPLPRLMDSKGRIHTTFNQEATATGRISSSSPNLQNIPVKGPMGRRMRSCFIAPQGKLLLALDYSQIELRVLAHLSGDVHLLEAFHKNEDIHARTASLIFENAPDQISADQRRMAKTINFGLLYGMGARKLSAELKIPEKEAEIFIKRYFSHLSGLKIFYEKIIEDAIKNGFVTTMSGRRRWLPGIASANGQVQAQAKRQAVNAVIQGTAADIIKIAMLKVEEDNELKLWNSKLILQVHDELLLETPEEFAVQSCKKVLELMQGVKPGGMELAIPLAVDWGIGKNWNAAH